MSIDRNSPHIVRPSVGVTCISSRAHTCLFALFCFALFWFGLVWFRLVCGRYRADLFVATLVSLFVGHLLFHSKLCFHTGSTRRKSLLTPDDTAANNDDDRAGGDMLAKRLEEGRPRPRTHLVTKSSFIATSELGAQDVDPCCAQLEVDDMPTPRELV